MAGKAKKQEVPKRDNIGRLNLLAQKSVTDARVVIFDMTPDELAIFGADVILQCAGIIKNFGIAGETDEEMMRYAVEYIAGLARNVVAPKTPLAENKEE